MSAALPKEADADVSRYMSALGQAARQAADVLAHADPRHKNHALLAIGEVLDQRREFILQENSRDLEAASKEHISEIGRAHV